MAESPLKVEEWLHVSEDVREILERLKRAEERPPSLYERLCKLGNKVFGGLTRGMKVTESTKRELGQAKIRVSPSEYWAGFFLTLSIPVLVSVLAWLLMGLAGSDLLVLWWLPVSGLVLGCAFGMVFYLYPPSLAGIKRSEAQGEAIHTIMLLSFALYHKPDLRGATILAANESKGELAGDLQHGLLELDTRRRYESVRHMLTVLAHRWGEIDEGTRQALFDILRSTGAREEASRISDVSRAPQRVLEGSEAQLNKRLNALVMPTMAFMVFGSLAIVGVIGLSPLFGAIGVNFVQLHFFVLAALLLVAGFFAFTTYMGRLRPMTLPPPEIPEDDSRRSRGKARIPEEDVPLWLLPLSIFIVLAWPGFLYFAGVRTGVLGTLAQGANAFWFIWSTAVAVAVHAHLYASKWRRLREEERRKSADWGAAFNTIGSRVIDGKPMSQAMVETAELMPGSPVADQLRAIVESTEKYSIDVRRALFRRGLAKRTRNPLIRSFLNVITRIRRSSEAAAGRACMMAADFISTLHRVERRFRERIGEAMGNLWLVTVVLLPIVCAMSVWVMEFMSGISFTVAREAAGAGLTNLPFLLGTMEASELVLLKLVMGLTAIALAAVMARYIALISAGNDKVELWATMGKTVLFTTIVFTAAYLGFGLIKTA
ncbi:MAG: hypothetical protein ACE5OT_04595 [Candidatus Hadarchaeaceae archaeon]